MLFNLRNNYGFYKNKSIRPAILAGDTKRNTLGHKFEFTDFQIHSLLHEETNDLFMFNFESSLKLGWCRAQHFVGLRIPLTTGGF